MTNLAWAFVVIGTALYVQAWFEVVVTDYRWALIDGVMMFVCFIMASHSTDLDTA